jgi:hypothetical protein
VLVHNRICLGNLFFIGATATFEVGLLLALLDGIEKVITLLTELHDTVYLLDVYRFLLKTRIVRSKRTVGGKVVEG